MSEDFMYEELVHNLTECLAQLEQFRMINPPNKEILQMKYAVRQRITTIQERVQPAQAS